MYSRPLKVGYLILEGLNSFATVFFFFYFYFFMEKAYGFGNRANLTLAALNGGTYAVCVWWAGKFATRFGHFTALKLGFSVMLVGLALGMQVTHPAPQIVLMLLTVVGMCFTWPTLEALVSEGETRKGLQEMVGIYNVVWSATGAVAYFAGGAVLQKLGRASLFYVPIAIELSQLGLTLWLEAKVKRKMAVGTRVTLKSEVEKIGLLSTSATPKAEREWPSHIGRRQAQGFLRMAWVANPFAYIAINTLVAVMPGLARRLELSTMLAGFCGSVWCFARFGAFFGLWLWSGWHYRFRWLLLAYSTLVVSFAAILMVPNLGVLLGAQLALGLAVGLIYYSSLFYSMDLGDSKSEHGGLHEAAIGLGNFAGPAAGAASLWLAPHYAHSGALAVTGLLLAGLGGLAFVWRKGTAT
jgi:predicted MFS family arabinose efflux permease